MKYVLFFILGTMLFFSCRYIGGKRIRGNGNFVSRERSVSGFDGIESYGSFNIKVVPSPTTSVKVGTDENLQEYIETYVENGKLQVRERDGYNLRPRNDIEITVYGPAFTTLTTNGSGSITGSGLLNSNDENIDLRVAGSGNIDVELNGGHVESQIHGSGNIKVKGTSKKFKGGVYGSGNIRSADLVAEESEVEIAGSGNVEVNASNSLDVHIMGSGEVKHRGSAKVNTSIQGSGSVVRID